MNNHRRLIIPTIAVIAVILSLTALLAYNRSVDRAQTIPVTGRSNSGGSQSFQVVQQNQMANNGVSNGRESAEEIQAQQGLKALRDQLARQAQSARSSDNSQWVPGQEYILGQPAPAAINGVNSKWVPGQEYMQGQ
jgi:hypothetical protein